MPESIDSLSRGKGRGKPKPPPPSASVVVVDPVTRLEGHLKIEVKVDNGYVVDARATGTLFRGFEQLLLGRHPSDAQHITQRICGVCPVSHGMAAVLALDAAYGVTVPENARIMRNLVMGANMIDSHILHFYHLALPDFITGPDMPPWQPSWNVDKRFSASQEAALVNSYVTALAIRRKAHEMGALLGGRLPHPPTYVPGGFTASPDSNKLDKFESYLTEIISFINNTYIPDVHALKTVYADYFFLGGGYGNLLAFGAFDQGGGNLLFKRGRIANAAVSYTVAPVDVAAITEKVTYSWYSSPDNLNPAVGQTTPVDPAAKTGAYSWLKAPRYEGLAYEAGALARMRVSQLYDGGVSVMDRHLARAYETLHLAEAMVGWVQELRDRLGQPVYTAAPVPSGSRTAIGLTEAPRGALGHWLEINSGKITHYQVITPTCWNASPRGAGDTDLGPLEKALIGTPVANINQPIEVLRVIHSFDPCLSCAVHVMRPDEGGRIFAVPHFHGGEEIHAHDHGDGFCHGQAAGHPHAHDHGPDR